MRSEAVYFDRPSQIDGTPTKVRAQAVESLRDAALALGDLVDDSLKQIEGADIGDMLLEDDHDGANLQLVWARSERGEASEEVRIAAANYARAVASLLRSSVNRAAVAKGSGTVVKRG